MAVASAVSMGMGSLNFGLYIKPMGDELGKAGHLLVGPCLREAPRVHSQDP